MSETDDQGEKDAVHSVCTYMKGKEGTVDLEDLLKALFEYQSFEQNAELQGVIDKVHARYASRMLSDEEADWVAAAGMPETARKRNGPLADRDEHQ